MKQNFKRFLDDKEFISWQLTEDPYLQAHWEEYIDQHPEEKEDFEKAIQEFTKIQLNKESLSDQEFSQLLQQIHISVTRTHKKKRTLSFIKYAAAACLIAFVSMATYQYFYSDTDEPPFLTDHLIVGENLEEKEIYLITDSETTSFSNDVRVHMDKGGSVLVEELGENGKSSVIEPAATKMNKLVVPYGKRSELLLADGTKAWVNSGSVLEFPSSFNGRNREVNLIGEVFIEVAKDSEKPFIVNTKDLQVIAYGTQFNVSAYQDTTEPSVVLVEGSVGVKSSVIKGEIKLIPNDKLTLYGNEMEKIQVDISQYISWKDGYMILNKTSMTDVLTQIERYYNLTFNIPDIKGLNSISCTGKIYLSDDLDNVMETISLLSSTKYKREEKTIYINY